MPQRLVGIRAAAQLFANEQLVDLDSSLESAGSRGRRRSESDCFASDDDDRGSRAASLTRGFCTLVMAGSFIRLVLRHALTLARHARAGSQTLRSLAGALGWCFHGQRATVPLGNWLPAALVSVSSRPRLVFQAPRRAMPPDYLGAEATVWQVSSMNCGRPPVNAMQLPSNSIKCCSSFQTCPLGP